MTWIHVIDWSTGTASFGVKFIGFPAQLRHNRSLHADGQTGTPVLVAAILCVSYALWVVHGAAHHDLTEMISQGVGVLTTGALLVQVLCYRGS